MRDTRVTVASLRSLLIDPQQNLERVEQACKVARQDGARVLFLPELMLTGHGGHPRMVENAEPVAEGPLSQEIVSLSREYGLCICVGLAELDNLMVYNSQMVVDRGEYLGLQRKINLSGDEYCYFAPGDEVPVFDIGELRFGITICYDSSFPELALLHSLNRADLILAPHAARTGEWPDELTPDFCAGIIDDRQRAWELLHRARAIDHNLFVLLNNAVGPSTAGLGETKATASYSGSGRVVANHAGTVMGIDPEGQVFLRTRATAFVDEIVTVELKADRRQVNHGPSRNRNLGTVIRMLSRRLD